MRSADRARVLVCGAHGQVHATKRHDPARARRNARAGGSPAADEMATVAHEARMPATLGEPSCFRIKSGAASRQTRDILFLVPTFKGHFIKALQLLQSLVLQVVDCHLLSVRFVVSEAKEEYGFVHLIRQHPAARRNCSQPLDVGVVTLETAMRPFNATHRPLQLTVKSQIGPTIPSFGWTPGPEINKFHH